MLVNQHGAWGGGISVLCNLQGKKAFLDEGRLPQWLAWPAQNEWWCNLSPTQRSFKSFFISCLQGDVCTESFPLKVKKNAFQLPTSKEHSLALETTKQNLQLQNIFVLAWVVSSNRLPPQLCCTNHGLLEARRKHLDFPHPGPLLLWILQHDEAIRTFSNPLSNRTR